MIKIGSRRELFIDEILIDRLDNVSFKFHEPIPAGIAVKYDLSHESSIAFYTTVIKDNDLFRMYYRGTNLAFNPTKFPDDHLLPSGTFYAESTDGANWTKPDLGIVEVRGSKHNNAIFPSIPVYPFGPFVDANPTAHPEQRYKAVARHVGGSLRHLMAYASSDGINWNLMQEDPIIMNTLDNNFDSQNVAFWSEAEGCYVTYMRYMLNGIRSISRAVSSDFLNWSDQTPMMYSDTGTTMPSQHLYTNQTQAYFRAPHIYIAMPARIFFGKRLLSHQQAVLYKEEVEPISGGAGDVSDGVFMTSRAGETTYNFQFRESYVRPGIGSNNWTSRSNYPAAGIVQTGPDEMSLYVHRQYALKSAHLQRMTLRLDGFVSLNAKYDQGEIITKTLTFKGRYLEINYSTSAAGYIRIELQDASGKTIPGYSLEDSPYIIGDEISRKVGWDIAAVREQDTDSESAYNEGPIIRERPSDISHLADVPVRIRFVVKDADLYSLKFCDSDE